LTESSSTRADCGRPTWVRRKAIAGSRSRARQETPLGADHFAREDESLERNEAVARRPRPRPMPDRSPNRARARHRAGGRKP
jgi:hypothetical protein